MFIEHSNPNDKNETMNYQPKNEQQLREEREAKRQLLDVKATYEFDVVNATETTSKSSGKDMLVLTLDVHHEGGTKRFTDYIVCDQDDKLFSFCKSIRCLEAYHHGTFGPDDCAGTNGQCKLGIEKGSAAPDGGFYPDKNKVRQYVDGDAEIAGKTAPAMAGTNGGSKFTPPKDDDDDIPF